MHYGTIWQSDRFWYRTIDNGDGGVRLVWVKNVDAILNGDQTKNEER